MRDPFMPSGNSAECVPDYFGAHEQQVRSMIFRTKRMNFTKKDVNLHPLTHARLHP